MFLNRKAYSLLKIIIIFGLFFVMFDNATSTVRLRGSVNLSSYGYEDQTGDDHLWLLQTTRFSLTGFSIPLSMHFTGGYIGDKQDDFSASGSASLLKGYLQYGGIGSPIKARLGRFFIYRGVGLGVLDGVDVERKLNNSFKLALFAGMMGPKSTEFEIEDPGEAFSAGGELKWSFKKKFWRFRDRNLSLSYTYQTRANKVIRQRLGLSVSVRYNRHTTAYMIMHLRPTSNSLKKAIGRIRYSSDYWNGMIEGGIKTVDMPEYSWFSDFSEGSYQRIRLSFNRYFIPREYGAGFDGSVLMAGSKSGFRIGPSLTTPYGQIGYRKYFGSQASADGPWAVVRYSPITGVEAYANGSIVSYEWDAFDIEPEDLAMLQTGVRYTPAIRKDMTVSLEYQVYRSPQFTSDRRFMGGIDYRFDSRR